MVKSNTRERILLAALDLYAERGFDGVGVDELAEVVGISGPAIYRYFKGKNELFHSLIEMLDEHYEENVRMARERAFIPRNGDEFKHIVLIQLNTTIHDPLVIKARKILNQEQYRNEYVSNQASKHFIDEILKSYTILFEKMIEKGLLNDDDAEMLAFQFSLPIGQMIQMLDREPQRENEARALLNRHIDHFVKTYFRK